jgi:hypothetical protein
MQSRQQKSGRSRFFIFPMPAQGRLDDSRP